ncbi:DNA-binding transcriptional regulator, LysR family [Roseomonas rosea]|uniref:DNA-binding transcriptional regulator, LysR family n=1 Tax=Muricoccus roseus TaxID=198092 RepID=A0A1M6RHX5_9PROT|nr:LysR substrate-binding domain-containing protein [Roseomonas rosea]SHK32030.1 DNA-binding transcriptional regulator, LysR family [Roseomonas rosea]
MRTADTEEAAVESGRTRLELRYWWSFCALVEQRSLAGAARRTGLSEAQLLGHLRMIEREIGQPLFHRRPGFAASPAALHAHARLRPLLDRAAFLLRFLRVSPPAAPDFLPVGLPPGAFGGLLGQGFHRFAVEWAERHPHLCLLPVEGAGAGRGSSLRYLAGPPRPGLLRDRWVLLRPAGTADEPAGSAWAQAPVMLPLLPEPLPELVAALVAHEGGRVVRVDQDIGSLLAEAAEYPDFRVLVPAGLVDPECPVGELELLPLPPGPADPLLALDDGEDPQLAALLRAHLAAALSRAEPAALPGLPETLSLKHSRSFLALHAERNMSRAAARLHIVQPALTLQLRQIEAQAGQQLFRRTSRGLEPTPEGHRLHGLLQPLVAELQAVVEGIGAEAGPSAQTLRIGLLTTLDDQSMVTERFALALQAWRRRHGRMHVQVLESFSAELIRWLHHGRIDMALVNRRIADPLLETEVIAEDCMVAVADARRGVLPPGPVTLQQLSALPLVLPSGRHALRALITPHLAARGITAEPRLEVDSMSILLRLVATGGYVTVLPLGAIEHGSARRGLSLHELVEPRISRQICLVRQRGASVAAASRDLVAALRVAFGKAG